MRFFCEPCTSNTKKPFLHQTILLWNIKENFQVRLYYTLPVAQALVVVKIIILEKLEKLEFENWKQKCSLNAHENDK